MNEHHERRHAEMNRVLTSVCSRYSGHPWGEDWLFCIGSCFMGGCAVERVVMEEAG